jgi:hypothetical protein
MLRWVDDIEAKLASLEWAVAEADRAVFCTSDNPVVAFRPTKDLAGFHGISPDSEAEIRVALDPTHLLLGTANRLGPDRFRASKQLIIDTNRSTARECQNAMFYLPGTIPAGDLQLAPHSPRISTAFHDATETRRRHHRHVLPGTPRPAARSDHRRHPSPARTPPGRTRQCRPGSCAEPVAFQRTTSRPRWTFS